MSEQLKAFQAATEADAGLQKKEVKAASNAAPEILEETDLARLSGGMVSEFQNPPDFGPVNKVYTSKQIWLIACAEPKDYWLPPPELFGWSSMWRTLDVQPPVNR